MAALVMLRGPLTNAQAVWSVAVSAGVGLPAGWVIRSRWAMLAAPVAFWAAMELSRTGVRGPSVDAFHASPFGVLAFVTGRGVQALLTAAPMALAAAWGAGIARRAARSGARCASTWPPSRSSSSSRPWTGVAGAASSAGFDRIPATTPETEAEDVGTVTEYLRRRFRQDRIYLLGHSGGSIVSVLAVRDHPERYRAYIGTGQAVDLTDSDRRFHADILAWARATGRDDIARRLADQGPPPYDDVYDYETIMTYGPRAYGQSGEAFVVDVPEHTLLEKAHTLTGIVDTWDTLYPGFRGIDLRTDAPRLAVPVYFVQGAAEMRGLAVVFDDWYAHLQAPARHLEVLEGAGHRVMFERPEHFTAIMARVVAETGAGDAPPGR